MQVKFFHFINERDGRVDLMAVAAPKTEWSSPLDVFQEALAHEQKVTGLINDLVDLALSERDHAANAFLQWYINEQVEEESHVDGIVQNLKLIKDHPESILLIDRELAQRPMPTIPPQTLPTMVTGGGGA